MEELVKQITKKIRLYLPEKLPKNLILKLVSLFFTFFLWYFVVGEDKIDTTIYVPLEITNLSQNLVISNQFRKQLEVTINGPRGLVRSISSQHITRPVNLIDVKTGNHVIKNTPESIKLPNGVQIQNIRPANISLTIDHLLTKELPIKAVLTGKPATGYEIASFTATPPTLGLTAPAAILEDQIFLPTLPISISGQKTNFTVQVQLDVKDEITELIGEPVISVNVSVREKLIPREFSNIPVEFDHEAERTTYHLDHHQVNIKAELPYLLASKNGNNFHFKATISADQLPPGQYELPVTITTNPPGIKIIEIIPAKIKLEISAPKPLLKYKPKTVTVTTAQPTQKGQ